MAPLTCMILCGLCCIMLCLYWLQIQLKSWPLEHFYTVVPYRYIGCEFGMVSVLKYDAEGRRIIQLPYRVPTNIIAGNCYFLTIGWCWRQKILQLPFGYHSCLRVFQPSNYFMVVPVFLSLVGDSILRCKDFSYISFHMWGFLGFSLLKFTNIDMDDRMNIY
jgi:hypothetical protein